MAAGFSQARRSHGIRTSRKAPSGSASPQNPSSVLERASAPGPPREGSPPHGARASRKGCATSKRSHGTDTEMGAPRAIVRRRSRQPDVPAGGASHGRPGREGGRSGRGNCENGAALSPTPVRRSEPVGQTKGSSARRRVAAAVQGRYQ